MPAGNASSTAAATNNYVDIDVDVIASPAPVITSTIPVASTSTISGIAIVISTTSISTVPVPTTVPVPSAIPVSSTIPTAISRVAIVVATSVPAIVVDSSYSYLAIAVTDIHFSVLCDRQIVSNTIFFVLIHALD